MTTITAADHTATELREALAAKYREDRRNSRYEGKVWFTKTKDKYGRAVRHIIACTDGEQKTIGAVVLVPRWTEDLKAQYGMERYFTNDWVKGNELRAAGEKPEGAITQHKTLKSALAQFGCGTKEYELYSK